MQEVKRVYIKKIVPGLSIFIICMTISKSLPNGVRDPLVGGRRERRFDGTSFKPRKLLENAQTPTSRVHAVLGSDGLRTATSSWIGSTNCSDV